MNHVTIPSMPLRSTARAAQLLLAWPLLTMPAWVGAEVADTLLSNAPLGLGASSQTVLPNVALVLDDSTSMSWENMPDQGGTNDTSKCYGHSDYNSLAYNPNVVYKPPYKPDGVVPAGNPYGDNKPRYPEASFGDKKAWSNGYTNTTGSSVGNTNLDTAPLKFGSRSGTRYYYSIYASGVTPKKEECLKDTQYVAIIKKVDIEGRGEKGTPKALTNYANWYSYYRSRINMMKGATGEAFSSIGDTYRVGLFHINTPTAGGNTHTAISDFTDTHKQTWFSNLYATTIKTSPIAYTPLRGALSRMGRMYGGRETTLGDPTQFSCQQNFTILTTDGYWNSETPVTKSLYGNLIGDVDSGDSIPDPYKDRNKNADTLSDVAWHYYTTDLRNENDESQKYCTNQTDNTIKGLCKDNVPGTGDDKRSTQRMITFTLGLGVKGTITYEPNYLTAPDNTSDNSQYIDIGKKFGNTIRSWANITNLNCTNDCPPQIDDLWHAAVNGRGEYYSASDPASVEKGLRSALAGASSLPGSGAAAGTSSLEPVSGDNTVFIATYETVSWHGDLRAIEINPATGGLSDTTKWSAQSKIDAQFSDATKVANRSIWYFDSTTSNKLKSFTFANLDADTNNLGDLFKNACTNSWLTQCNDESLVQAQIDKLNSGTEMVNYLRGDRTNEPVFRNRAHLLGDPVNATPVYVKQPQFDYGKYDPTYNTFKSDKASRGGTVYLAANDGMLHAINTEGTAAGTERWAYVPSFVMKNMTQLADTKYTHRYFVDGSPTVADVCTSYTAEGVCSSSSAWRTVLVGGLNKGGCGYYALDITDPANPKGLWEFQHAQLGFSYGNPIITRKSNGKWVVIFSSGYYNVPSACGNAAADGVGRVFVLDAMTGQQEGGSPISTEAGNDVTPSNLGKLNAWVDDAQRNIADAVYGGDMLGNLWRIDFDGVHDKPTTSKDAFKLATLNQPITVKPELAEVKGKRIIMVGTGKLLATSDLTTKTPQFIYGLKDDLTAETGIGNPHAAANEAVIKPRTTTQGTSSEGAPILTVTGDAIDWTTDKGWYLNLQTAGERLNVGMQLQYNILTAVTNVPENNACTIGGISWLYYIDIETGKNLTTATDDAIGHKLSTNSTSVGITTVKLEDGSTSTVVSNTDGTVLTDPPPSATGSSVSEPRRTMWREILD